MGLFSKKLSKKNFDPKIDEVKEMIAKTDEIISQKKTDNRYLPRWPAHLHASYRGINERQHQTGFIKSISCGGACLSVDGIIYPQQRIRLTVSFFSGSCINVDGIVHWTKTTDTQRLAGIKFLNMCSADQETILNNFLGISRTDLLLKGWNNPGPASI